MNNTLIVYYSLFKFTENLAAVNGNAQSKEVTKWLEAIGYNG